MSRRSRDHKVQYVDLGRYRISHYVDRSGRWTMQTPLYIVRYVDLATARRYARYHGLSAPPEHAERVLGDT